MLIISLSCSEREKETVDEEERKWEAEREISGVRLI